MAWFVRYESMPMPRFYVRNPSDKERRKGFRLYRDGHPVVDARVEAINKQLLEKSLDLESAKEEINKIKDSYRLENKPERSTYPDKNLDVLDKAIKDYESRKKIRNKSRRVAISGLRRCIDLLGSKVLHSISFQDLNKLLDSQSPEAQPKIGIYLNVLLKHTGRTERLKVPAQPDPEIKYLTPEELEKILPYIKAELRIVVQVAFVSGARLGEVFGLQRFGRTASLWIERQMYDQESEGTLYGPCKWKKKRWTPVMADGQDIVRAWIKRLEEMEEKDKLTLRRLPWNEVVKDACKSAFPTKTHKHLNFRDIRHCYAVYWLDKGATQRHVAQSMGNTERVVAKHYSGFIQTDEAESTMLALEKKVG